MSWSSATRLKSQQLVPVVASQAQAQEEPAVADTAHNLRSMVATPRLDHRSPETPEVRADAGTDSAPLAEGAHPPIYRVHSLALPTEEEVDQDPGARTALAAVARPRVVVVGRPPPHRQTQALLVIVVVPCRAAQAV